MPRSQHGDDDFTEADRKAIADIRRQLDAEFGPLERAEPLAAEPSRVAPPPPQSPRSPRPVPPPRPSSPPPLSAPPRPSPRPRAAARAVPLFLLGAFVGAAVGGLSGGLAALLWLSYIDERGAVVPAPSIARGLGTVEQPAAAPRETPVAPRETPGGDTGAVESSLSEWLAATKTGDIEGQMRFYAVRVPVYYTWRDVPREAVRAEKVRVFARVTRLAIDTDKPSVELRDGGASAVTRFRKRYVIEGPNVRRRGEVLQELRWMRTPDGWRIVGERDAEVLAPSAAVGPDAPRRGGTIDRAR